MVAEKSRTPGLTSIIIPTFNHGHVLADAIECAMRQTARVEVIVVDDGSTDDTATVVGAAIDRWRKDGAPTLTEIVLDHAGASAARNAGIEAAAGEFMMFLDADDVMDPGKVERQLAEFTTDVGWILCDVRIEDEARGIVRNASDQYGYAAKNIGGWIRPQLVEANFIPVMAPLVRASVLDGIRFTDERLPEDWYFWLEVASRARARYLPEVLATYRHGRTGRSRLPKVSHSAAPFTAPLRLNLGCGTPGTRSWHPIEGMINLDKSTGWRFEDGLGDFADGSVHGITISHTLMYVPFDLWPYVFSEFARVLTPGGVIRITEDDTTNERSSRCGGWKGSQPAVTLTDAATMIVALERAGLQALEVEASSTLFSDQSLLQAQHGAPPDVFFVEGVK